MEGAEMANEREGYAAVSGAMADAVALAGQAVVQVDARRRQPASGLVWSTDGLVVTADHVMEREDDIGIGLPDGSRTTAELVGRDSDSDLALLRVTGLAVAPGARGEEPRVGALATVVARPGRAVEASLAMVSAIGGPVRTRRGGRLEGYLRVDAVMYPGFSGGALTASDGTLLGMATSLFGRGSAIALTPATVDRVVGSLLAHGRIRRAFLGVSSQPVQLPEAARAKVGADRRGGLLLVGVESGGPADRAGLAIGDILVDIGGHAIQGVWDLRDALTADLIGQSVEVRILRGGEPIELGVVVGERA
jgi:S1-C subfamily serine protease